jgi:predicted metal-dependent enzyme (double-stranded beta helix superfamily)
MNEDSSRPLVRRRAIRLTAIGLQKEIGMFESEQFIADCRAAFAAGSTRKAVREVLARATSEPAAVLRRLGEPKRAESRTHFHTDSLTILNVILAPGMMVMPHNHRMWAVIGIYSGREDSISSSDAFQAHQTELRPPARRLCANQTPSPLVPMSSIQSSTRSIG